MMMSAYRMGFAALLLGVALTLPGAYVTTEVWSSLRQTLPNLAPGQDWSMLFDQDLFSILFWTLFAIMNPLAAIPLFLSATEGSPRQARSRYAALAAITVFAAVVVVALCGQHILNAFSVSADSMRIAGGIIVLLMGIQLLQSEAGAETSDGPAVSGDHRGRSKMICPLAIPFLIGPGAITTIMVQTDSAVTVAEFTSIAAAFVALSLIVFATLKAAVPLARYLGDVGLVVIARIGGMIVAAIAIDMLVTGLRNTFPVIG